MSKWNGLVFATCLILSLTTTIIVFRFDPPPKPGVLAEVDVVNSATIATPGPSAIPTLNLTPTLYPGQPTPTLSPTPSLTPIVPTPTILVPTQPPLEPPISPVPSPSHPVEQFFSYSLFGYTSSKANVRLEGIKLLEGTMAKEDGYFEFIGFMASNRNKEFCLTTIDTENLVAPPLCVPVPEPEARIKYGPYLLPPTLRLSKGEINSNESTLITGKTIPGASIKVFIFNQPEQTLANRLFKPAYAASTGRPMTIKLASATDGSYSTRVSSNDPGKKRVFSQSVFMTQKGGSKTPKSVTLTINIFSILMAFLIGLIALLRPFLTLNFLLFLQALVVLFLIARKKKLFSWYHLQQQKNLAIVRYQSQVLVIRAENYTPLERRSE